MTAVLPAANDDPAGADPRAGAAAPGTDAALAPDDVRTRKRVLSAVLDDGPITASQLAKRLGLTAAAIRRHLDSLQEAGQIDVQSLTGTRARRGRPARQYVVTSAGHSQLANDYDHLASSALLFLREVAGESAVTEFAGRRGDDMERKYLPLIEAAGEDMTARAQALAKALAEDGYAASTSLVAPGTPMEALQLCQGHCPVQQVAAEFPELCEAERQSFARMLGVDVRRLSTLANGDHVCTTHIPISSLIRPASHRPPPAAGSDRGGPSERTGPENSLSDISGRESIVPGNHVQENNEGVQR